MDLSTMTDSSDTSRKRCASSVAGDRVVKSMKLEPQDDSPPLQIPPSSAIPPPMVAPPTHFTYPAYSLSSTPPSLSSANELASIPPPVPPAPLTNSRPPSSAGIPPPLSLGIIPDPAQQVVGTMHSAIPMDSVASLSHSPEFISPTSATSAAMSGIVPGSVWPDSRATVPRQHHHSLSAGAILNNGFVVSKPVPVAGPSTMSYTTPMYSPTRSTHLQQAPLNAASATLGRASRSQSISNLHGNPFAHVPDTVPHPTMFESTQSRPSTSGRHSPRPSSPTPEWEGEEGRDSDDEGGERSQGNQYASLGQSMGDPYTESISSAEGLVNGTTRSHAGQRRMSRTSPSNEGGSSSSHGNEVPQEYRSEVERIFFDFLDSICSNRTYTPAAFSPAQRRLSSVCVPPLNCMYVLLHSGCHRFQGRADPPDAHGKEDAAPG